MKEILFWLALFAIALNWQSLMSLTAGEIDYDPAVSGDVTLYSAEWCGYCTKTRRFLERNDIPFTEYDVEKSDEGMQQFMLLEGYGVPVTVVGDEVIRGYRLRQLAKALDSDS